MKTMAHKYGKNSGEAIVVYKYYFKLKFRFDDINVKGAYPRTGCMYSEDIWSMLIRKKMVTRGSQFVEEHDELGFTNVLTIHLVTEEEYQKRNAKNPKRKMQSVAFHNSDSDDYEGGGFLC